MSLPPSRIRRWIAPLTIALTLVVHMSSQAQNAYPPPIEADDRVTYKTIDGHSLDLWVFTPTASEPRPAIVFFFGGGWRQGTPTQFIEQSKWLVSRGMVAIIADYRVSSRHETKVVDAIADARSAVRFVRANAARWNIDPRRIAAGGGSAGGHLAASTATITAFDSSDEPQDVSAEPNALVLFNPALALAPIPGHDAGANRQTTLRERVGADLASASPAHNLDESLPPTIVLHGRADRVVPYPTAEYFCDEAQSIGRRCRLVGYDGEGHGFFNHSRSQSMFQATMTEVDRFLVELGWIAAR